MNRKLRKLRFFFKVIWMKYYSDLRSKRKNRTIRIMMKIELNFIWTWEIAVTSAGGQEQKRKNSRFSCHYLSPRVRLSTLEFPKSINQKMLYFSSDSRPVKFMLWEVERKFEEITMRLKFEWNLREQWRKMWKITNLSFVWRILEKIFLLTLASDGEERVTRVVRVTRKKGGKMMNESGFTADSSKGKVLLLFRSFYPNSKFYFCDWDLCPFRAVCRINLIETGMSILRASQNDASNSSNIWNVFVQCSKDLSDCKGCLVKLYIDFFLCYFHMSCCPHWRQVQTSDCQI